MVCCSSSSSSRCSSSSSSRSISRPSSSSEIAYYADRPTVLVHNEVHINFCYSWYVAVDVVVVVVVAVVMLLFKNLKCILKKINKK